MSDYTLKGYGELCRLAVGLGVDAPVAAWLALRDYDRPGRGVIPADVARDTLTDAYGLGERRTIYRLLAAGEGWLWIRSGGNLYLRALDRVISYLIRQAKEHAPDLLTARQDGLSPAGWVIDIPLKDLQTKPGRRLAFYAGWVGVSCRGEHPAGITATLDTLARLWGVSRRVVVNWDHADRITKKANWINAPVWVDAPDHAQQKETDEGPRLIWRGPNTRYSAPPTRPGGLAHRLRDKIQHKRGRPVDYAGGDQVPVRLFWRDRRTLNRAWGRESRRKYPTGRFPSDVARFIRYPGNGKGAPPRTNGHAWRGRWWRWEMDRHDWIRARVAAVGLAWASFWKGKSWQEAFYVAVRL